MISSHSKASLFAIVRPCRLRAPSHTRISTVKQQARPQLASLKPSTHRQFSQTSSFAHPRKGSQDKDSIDTEATEYTKSATDDEAARQGDAAFNPDITDPQEMKDVAGKGPEATVRTSVLPPTLTFCSASYILTKLCTSALCHLGANRQGPTSVEYPMHITSRLLIYYLRRVQTTLLTSALRIQK